MKHFIPLYIFILFFALSNSYPQSWQKLNGPWTGYLNTLTTNSSNPAFMFAGGTAGIFRSTDNGLNWVKVSAADGSRFAQGNSLADYVISPTESSTDGGISWKGITLPLESNIHLVKDIAINPNSAGNVFLIDNDNLYFSPDFAQNWTLSDDSTNEYPYNCEIIKISKTPAHLIYTIGYNGYIRKSTNGGVSWTGHKYTSLPLSYPYDVSADLNPENGNLLYIGRGSTFYKTTNGGLSWSSSYVDESGIVSIAASKIDPNIIYAAHRNGISKSTNGGSTWSIIFNNDARETITSIICLANGNIIKTTEGQGIFASSDGGLSYISTGGEPVQPNGMRFQNSDNTLIAWDTKGVYKSINAGISWKLCIAKGSGNDNGLSISSANPANWTLCTNDYANKLYLTFNSGDSWGALSSAVIDYPKEVFHNPANSVHVYLKSGPDIARSLDYANHWSLLPEPFTGETLELLTFNPSNENQLLASANTCLCIVRSDDAGMSWYPFTNGIEESGTGTYIYDIKFNPQNHNVIYASAGKLYRLTLPSTTWTKIFDPGSANAYSPNKLLIDPTNSQKMYSLYAPCTIIGSNNGGSNWGKANTGLPDKYKTASSAFMSSTGKIYLVTGAGVVYGNPLVTDVSDYLLPTDSPSEYLLEQNYPNPANPVTNINYSIPYNSNVTLKLYDVLGAEVAELLNENKGVGNYSIQIKANDYPSGIYIYTLRAGSFTESRKMILMK